MAHHFMFGDPRHHIFRQFLPLSFVLFVVPPQFFEIEVHKIAQKLSFSVHSTKHNHVLPHQRSSVTPPPLNGLFIAHSQHAGGPSL